MSETLVSEDNAPIRLILRPIIRALRTAYIQGTTVVKLMKDNRAIQMYYKYRRKTYDIQWAMDPGYKKGLRRLVELSVEESDRVLDVGCGTGSATVVAAGTARDVVGIDLSPDMIELARKKINKKCLNNTAVFSTSVEDYHPDGLYDKVISSFMIPHIKPNQRPAIYSCMYRFLKPGGTVALFGSRGEVCDVYETRSEVEENLTRSGFEDLEIHDVYDIYRIAIAKKPLNGDESA
jgi:cyclopropane fatty-acyl-phospholipid synthase-like methyltransferase